MAEFKQRVLEFAKDSSNHGTPHYYFGINRADVI